MQKVKKMGVWELTLLVLVNMMGSGIILLPTKLASVGTISILSWFITGGAVACLAYAFAKCGMSAVVVVVWGLRRILFR